MPTPEDIVELRRTDPAAAARWRHRLRDELGGRARRRRPVVGFTRGGEYVVGSAMIERDLRRASCARSTLPLVAPFRTSFGSQTEPRILLVRAEAERDGDVIDGLGRVRRLRRADATPPSTSTAPH